MTTDNSPTQTTRRLMPLDDMHTEIADMVREFRNEMLRDGARDRTPQEWWHEFISWGSGERLRKKWERVLEWLREESSNDAT